MSKLFLSSWYENLKGGFLKFKRLAFFRSKPFPWSASVGAQGEQIACTFLKRMGYRILARQQRAGRNEIDIIAMDDSTIVFVEVKTWRGNIDPSRGGPSDSVDDRKQARLTSAALRYLKANALLEHRCRFDVVEVQLPARSQGELQSGQPAIRHFQSAFEAHGNFQMFS